MFLRTALLAYPGFTISQNAHVDKAKAGAVELILLLSLFARGMKK